jgi:hypothetical protein
MKRLLEFHAAQRRIPELRLLKHRGRAVARTKARHGTGRSCTGRKTELFPQRQDRHLDQKGHYDSWHNGQDEGDEVFNESGSRQEAAGPTMPQINGVGIIAQRGDSRPNPK